MKECKRSIYFPLIFAFSVIAASAVAAPVVSNVSMSQADDGLVTVGYHLEGAPAVITFDLLTNGVSIGDANIYRLAPPMGDVSKLISENGDYSFVWAADAAWPDHAVLDNTATAKVTAWTPADPPDYLVADLTAVSNVNYYTSADALPRGLFGDDAYRTSKIVLRRIHAEGVEWTKGIIGEKGGKSALSTVILDNDYYMAVFPITQAQYAILNNGSRAPFGFRAEGWWAKRVNDGLMYNTLRATGTNQDDANTHYPNPPGANSYLGQLRAKTGLAFDLPSDNQWEFAARAGHGEGTWGDGTPFMNTRENVPGRCAGSSEVTSGNYATCDDTIGTPTAGSYPCNDFGLYDMNGGIHEWCLEWNDAGTARLLRGGSWYRPVSYARNGYRGSAGPNDGGRVAGEASIRGGRVACSIPAEL